MAESIGKWFQDKEHQQILQKLTVAGVIFEKIEQASRQKTTLAGKTFVLTGSLQQLTRDEARDLIRKLGGDVSSSVSTQTDYVVVGEEPGSKYAKAVNLGVRTISENDFLKMLKDE
jgi:DNA ligase (NAD+)